MSQHTLPKSGMFMFESAKWCVLAYFRVSCCLEKCVAHIRYDQEGKATLNPYIVDLYHVIASF